MKKYHRFIFGEIFEIAVIDQSCKGAKNRSGKKSRSRNVKKSVTDSSQKKILDFYRGLSVKEKDSGDA